MDKTERSDGGSVRIVLAEGEQRPWRLWARIGVLVLTVVLASAGVLVVGKLLLPGPKVKAPPSTLDARANVAGSAAPAVRVVPGQARLVLLGPLPLVQGGNALAAGAEVAVPLPTLPRGSSAVLLEVTLSDAAGPGTVTVKSGAGQVVALRLGRVKAQMSSTVVARVAADGVLRVRTEGGGKLVVNLVGAFEPVEKSTSGRVVPVPATQVVKLVPHTDGKFATVDLSAVPALRGGGYAAVLLQFAADVGVNGGFVETGLSVDRLDQKILWNPTTAQDRIRGGFLVVPVTAGGSVQIHYEAGNVLTADLVGYVTDGTAPDSDTGLVVPSPPSSVAEVRVESGQEALVTLAADGVPADRMAGAFVGITATGDALGAVTVHAPDAAAPANPTLVAAVGAARQSVTLVATAKGALRVGSAAGASVGLSPLAVVLGG
ncbi:hypothetical protein Rhe02_77910 [Rhizocola hellebori]|uniref:Uncharacterized protein n=1 Tax=Rhizocola hellebori TaxID=1392758 RepID=A0A8J3QHH2_9ACTN|nr:hypothetical protein [Rhizocola hellebori]GIH09724.1 hypothetical protein Rhe02_77910 [Rhizocola hellebori]